MLHISRNHHTRYTQIQNVSTSRIMALCMLTALVFLSMSPLHAQERNAMTDGFYTYTMKDIDGNDVPLSQYKGKVLIVVNVASKCGFTPQYKTLQQVYAKYKDRGFMVLGFPANNFGKQEPGTNSEIKEFCSTTFHVTFDMFSKISVKGEDIDPLYAYLTKESPFPGDITWNFNKFLVDKNGNVVARWDTRTDPMSEEVTSVIEKFLAQ